MDFLKPAGASQPHLHMHGLAQAHRPPGRINAFNHVKHRFRQTHGEDYLQRLFDVHQALGLCVEEGLVGEGNDMGGKGRRRRRRRAEKPLGEEEGEDEETKEWTILETQTADKTQMDDESATKETREEGRQEDDKIKGEENGKEAQKRNPGATLFCSHVTPAKNREIIFRVDVSKATTTTTTKTTPMRQVLRAVLRVIRHYFSLHRYTFSGAIYLPPAPMEGGGGRGARGEENKGATEDSNFIFGRFIPRTLLGAEYFDYSSSEIFVRTLIDLDPFKAIKEMRNSFKIEL